MSNLILNLWKLSGLYIRNRWQKGVGEAVGDADDDVPLQLKTRVVSYKVMRTLVVSYRYFIVYIEEILVENIARIYIKEVFIRHGALNKIILDRDLRFIAVF
jgi:hypothetical protein